MIGHVRPSAYSGIFTPLTQSPPPLQPARLQTQPSPMIASAQFGAMPSLRRGVQFAPARRPTFQSLDWCDRMEQECAEHRYNYGYDTDECIRAGEDCGFGPTGGWTERPR